MLRESLDQGRLAKRIELDYFVKPHPWRRAMQLVVVLVALASQRSGLSISLHVRQRGDVSRAGPFEPRHRMFGNDCMQCHVAWHETPERTLPAMS